MDNKATISEHLLVNYWKGEATEAERQQVEAWLAAHNENQELFSKWQLAWEHAAAIADFEAIDVEANWQQVKQKVTTEKPTQKRGFLPAVWRYAAAVLLIATLGILAWRSGTENTITAKGTDVLSSIILPDGTEVWLNKNATLTYPEAFAGNGRKVELTGEAFFEVVHNPEKPFSVMADGTETQVLGTSFNLKEMQGQALELVLVTGKVQFSKGEQAELLAPGDKIVVSDDGTVTRSQNTEANFMAWKTRRLVYDDTPMKEVVADIEALYGIRLAIENPAFENCPLTIQYQDDPLEAVFESFEFIFDARTEKTEEGYIIKGGNCANE